MNRIIQQGGIALAIAALCGCSATATTQPAARSTESAAASSAKSAAPADKASAPGPVTRTSNTEAALTFVPAGVRSLWKDPAASIVARGVVSKVEYRHDPVGTAYTLVTLDVEKTWRGANTKQLTFMELGGYIRQGDLEAINGPKDGIAPAADPNAWVDQRFMGATHSVVGDHEVVFLHRINGGEYDYELLQGPYGRYIRNSSGEWETLPADTISDPVVDESTLNKTLGS